MRQNIINSFRSGKKSVTSSINKPISQKKSLSIKTPVKKEIQSAKNKKHVITKSLLLIQNEISNVTAVQSPFLVSGMAVGDSLLDDTVVNSLLLNKRFASSSFQSPPRARKINLSKDLGQKSISSVKRSQQQLRTYRTVHKDEQKSSNNQRELIKNVNNYKDLNKQETIKSKKMSKNSKYLTNNNNQGQIKQKIRKPETSYQSQPNEKPTSRNPSMNLGQGQKSGFSLQLGGSSPKNVSNFQQNGNQYRNAPNSKPQQNFTVEEDIPLTDRTSQINSARHGLGDQYQMKTNLIANQNEVSYGQIQFQGDLGDDMPQSEVSDDESEIESPTQIKKRITPTQMLHNEVVQKPQMQHKEEEQKQEINDYRNLRNQRKQNKQNTSDLQLTSEMVNMLNINDSKNESNNKLQQSTFIREPREELNHQPAIFSLSVAPEPVVQVQNNKSMNQNQMLYQEVSSIKEVETSIEIEKPKQRTLQDYVKSLKPIEREMLKNNLAVLIQKWVRGHLTRIWYKKQKQINFKQMRKFRRMLTVAYNRLRNKQVKQIITVMKESGALHSDQNYQLWQKYKEHCAVMLQSHWQGYKARFLQIDEINMKIWDCKRSRLLTAIVKGFKTRLLLHEKGYHKSLHLIRQEMNKIANQNNGKAMVIDVNDKLTLKNLMRKRRQKVVEYIRQFDKSMKSKSILVALLKARRKGTSFNQNESQYMQTSKYDISNTSVIKPFEKEKKLQTKKSAKRWQDANNDDEPAPLDSMWPSVSVSNTNYGRDDSEEEEIKPKTASFWPSKQKEEQESTEAASFWPSRQKEEQKEEESSLSSMWPSKNKEKKNKKQVVLEQYSDDDGNDGDDIDWLNLPVKKPAVSKKEKPVQKQNFMPERKAVYNEFDEQPVGAANKANNSQANQNQNNLNFGEVAQFGVRNSGGVNGAIIPMQEQERDMPIRQSIHSEIEAPILPKYDFEKMIEEAMRNNGETPAVSAAPAVGEDQPVEQQKRILNKKKKVDPKKAALLAKRKSYDPRAAAQKAKKPAEDKSDISANEITQADVTQPTEEKPLKGNQGGLGESIMNQTELNKSQIDENEESPDQQQQNNPDRPPRPFLKRKTKALVIPKKKQEEVKTQGKSRIDCWQKDKDPNISYGNKKINRKSLLKKRPTNKIEEESSPFKPVPGSAVKQAEPPRTMAYKPSPIRARINNFEELEENESAIPDENESNEISQNNINNGRPSEGLSPNNINFYADMQNQNDEEQFNFDGQKLQIDDLEEQFDFLHGANYCQRGDEFSQNNPLPDNSKINSHDFKYSMIPFSEENNSQDVNLYAKQSRIPFLYKENMTEFGIKPQTPSLFFKCYSDDIYEAILEDLRSHYIAISNQDLDDSEENDIESDGHDEDEDEYGFNQGEVYQNTYTPDQPAVSGAAAGGRVNYQNRNMNRF